MTQDTLDIGPELHKALDAGATIASVLNDLSDVLTDKAAQVDTDPFNRAWLTRAARRLSTMADDAQVRNL